METKWHRACTLILTQHFERSLLLCMVLRDQEVACPGSRARNGQEREGELECRGSSVSEVSVLLPSRCRWAWVSLPRALTANCVQGLRRSCPSFQGILGLISQSLACFLLPHPCSSHSFHSVAVC